MRLRDIVARLDMTERSAHGIITVLTAAGYLVKQEGGRRNRYQIQAHLPCPNPPAGSAPSAKSWPSSRATTGPASRTLDRSPRAPATGHSRAVRLLRLRYPGSPVSEPLPTSGGL